RTLCNSGGKSGAAQVNGRGAQTSGVRIAVQTTDDTGVAVNVPSANTKQGVASAVRRTGHYDVVSHDYISGQSSAEVQSVARAIRIADSRGRYATGALHATGAIELNNLLVSESHS